MSLVYDSHNTVKCINSPRFDVYTTVSFVCQKICILRTKTPRGPYRNSDN